MNIAVATFLFAFLASYGLTPIIRAIARRLNFVDRPDGRRKIQRAPVALGGGLSLVICTPLAVFILCWMVGPDILLAIPKFDFNYDTNIPWSILGLLAAGILLAIVGVIDDGRGMSGRNKLIWQIVAVSFACGSGLQVEEFNILGMNIDLQFFGSFIALIWLLGAINSFNLIDGVDGLAGSVGVVFSLTIGTLALKQNMLVDAMIVFGLAGALLGFLRYNYAPATIYLGDTGSMFIGLILGAITLRSSTKEAATVAFSAPLAIWAIPIFDSLAAVLRRKLTGRSIYATDRGHFHHVLLTRGLNSGQAVSFITTLCAITSIAAISSVYLQREWIGMATVFSVIALLVLTRVFGHFEFFLLKKGLDVSFAIAESDADQQAIIAKQGNLWKTHWKTLVDAAERFQIVRLSLSLSFSREQQDFQSTWRSSEKVPGEATWRLDVPLVIEDQYVGRLRIAGFQNPKSPNQNISDFLEFLDAIIDESRELTESPTSDKEKENAGAQPAVK